MRRYELLDTEIAVLLAIFNQWQQASLHYSGSVKYQTYVGAGSEALEIISVRQLQLEQTLFNSLISLKANVITSLQAIASRFNFCQQILTKYLLRSTIKSEKSELVPLTQCEQQAVYRQTMEEESITLQLIIQELTVQREQKVTVWIKENQEYKDPEFLEASAKPLLSMQPRPYLLDIQPEIGSPNLFDDIEFVEAPQPEPIVKTVIVIEDDECHTPPVRPRQVLSRKPNSWGLQDDDSEPKVYRKKIPQTPRKPVDLDEIDPRNQKKQFKTKLYSGKVLF